MSLFLFGFLSSSHFLKFPLLSCISWLILIFYLNPSSCFSCFSLCIKAINSLWLATSYFSSSFFFFQFSLLFFSYSNYSNYFFPNFPIFLIYQFFGFKLLHKYSLSIYSSMSSSIRFFSHIVPK